MSKFTPVRETHFHHGVQLLMLVLEFVQAQPSHKSSLGFTLSESSDLRSHG
jgi:hypothetical protein